MEESSEFHMHRSEKCDKPHGTCSPAAPQVPRRPDRLPKRPLCTKVHAAPQRAGNRPLPCSDSVMPHIIVFPFETRRATVSAGTIARQSAALVAEHLQAGGASARFHPWVARLHEKQTWVLATGPLPAGVVAEELAGADAQSAIVGRVQHDEDEWVFDLASVTPDSDPAWILRVSAVSLHEALNQLLQRLTEACGLQPVEPSLPATDTALQAWMADRDLQAWMTLTSQPAADPALLYRHLLTVIDDPVRGPAAADTLLSRIDDALGGARFEWAAQAATAGLERQPDDDRFWRASVHAAESVPADQTEFWLRRVLSAAPDRCATRLRLGVIMIRGGRNEAAISMLELVPDTDENALAARTYRGIALAAIGREDEAVQLLTAVASSEADPQLRRIARENLARLRGL